jgi:hypothetical protein
MKDIKPQPGANPPAKMQSPSLPMEVWLDYIEGETDKSLKEDLERLLSYRPEYQQTVRELKDLKNHLKDTAQNLPGDEVFDQLKANIMAAIEKTTPDKKPTPWGRHNKAVTYTTMAMTAVVAGALLTHSGVKKKDGKNIEKMIAENLIEVSDDLLIDALADKLGQLSEKQVAEEIDKLK